MFFTIFYNNLYDINYNCIIYVYIYIIVLYDKYIIIV